MLLLDRYLVRNLDRSPIDVPTIPYPHEFPSILLDLRPIGVFYVFTSIVEIDRYYQEQLRLVTGFDCQACLLVCSSDRIFMIINESGTNFNGLICNANDSCNAQLVSSLVGLFRFEILLV